MHKFTRQIAAAAAVVALSTTGAALFAGTALAGTGGSGGSGGSASSQCVIPVGVSAGVIGQGGAASQCNAGGGAAGNGGNG